MAPISSKLRVVWRPWEGDDIAYVGHSGNEQHQPFEADAEPRMRCRAETACIEEPVHLFHGYVHFFHPLDRKSTRLNSSHVTISYAVFCLKKKINLLLSTKKQAP